MELKWLEDFVCLANTGSFWKASEERHVSQPAFSRRIRALENWLGITLIDRSSYPVSLTPYGRQFLPYAQDFLKSSNAIREEFRMLAGAAANEVRIATQHAISIYVLPRLVAALMDTRPEIKVVVIPSMQGVEHHFDALAQGLVHLLVTYSDESITANLPELDQLEEKAVGDDELAPFASARFAKAHALTDLRDGADPLPFLAYSGFSFSEKLVTPVARSLGRRLKPVYENSLSEGLKAMALADRGVAWLPRSAVERELASGDLVCVGGADLAVRTQIKAYRLKNAPPGAVGAMWALL